MNITLATETLISVAAFHLTDSHKCTSTLQMYECSGFKTKKNIKNKVLEPP
jgi:hypothetical protein